MAAVIVPGQAAPAGVPPPPEVAAIRWPDGTVRLTAEDADGVILVRATVRGRNGLPESGASPAASALRTARDTSGWFAIDTGAGFLALDSRLALELGVLDSLPLHSIDVAPHALPRLQLGDLAVDQVAPVLVFESGLLNRVTDRSVLGLIGHGVISDRVLWIDYQTRQIALVPVGPPTDLDDASAVGASRRLLSGTLSGRATPVRFRMLQDGKVLLKVRVTPVRGGGPTPWLTLALDTGASKCTLFEDTMDSLASTARWRPEIHGLVAPTLLEASPARLCRVKRVEVRGATGIAEAGQVEVALLRNPLARDLETLAGEPVHGLLGYSFLERFRIACDYPHQVLWLDPIPDHDGQGSTEPAQVGIQFEKASSSVRIVAVVAGSPAARAGIQAGDELVSIDGEPAARLGAAELGHKLEGTPGSAVRLVTRRGTLEQTHRLQRRRLL